MGDPDTRMKVLEILKEKCSLKTVLRLDKPCPYLGPSNSCDDCSFDWMTISDSVLKVVKARRASYEHEKEKFVQLKKEHDALSNESLHIWSLIYQVMEGVEAISELDNIRRTREENEDGRRSVGNKDQESVQGGGSVETDSEDGICSREVSE